MPSTMPSRAFASSRVTRKFVARGRPKMLKGANCTPNVGEFRAGLKDPGVPAVCCGTYRLFLLLFALCPVLSRPFPQNMRMRNAPRRNPVRPTGFLSYASHCCVGVDSIACQAATGLDDLNPGAFHGVTTNL